MAKEYFEGETKDERKARKRFEKIQKGLVKAQKSVSKTKNLPQESVVQIPKQLKDTKNYVVCLKHGSKYSSRYVNVLSRMVARHCTVPYEFVCFTDDVRGIDENIRTEPLPHIGVYGWWFKIMFFDKNFPLDGNILYMDLDIVINRNIDKLFLYEPDKFCIIRDFNRSLRHDWSRMNSSIIRYRSGKYGHIYDKFMEKPEMEMRRHHGDQDWIYAQMGGLKNKWKFWPDEWIRSYKWEMRDRNDLQKIGSVRNFVKKASPKVNKDMCIAVFHGEPHPHQCEDDWVKDNWQ